MCIYFFRCLKILTLNNSLNFKLNIVLILIKYIKCVYYIMLVARNLYDTVVDCSSFI